MTIKKEIVYPIFLECFQYITDKFWLNIFEDLAYGKAPYGTYISKGSLTSIFVLTNLKPSLSIVNSLLVFLIPL